MIIEKEENYIEILHRKERTAQCYKTVTGNYSVESWVLNFCVGSDVGDGSVWGSWWFIVVRHRGGKVWDREWLLT